MFSVASVCLLSEKGESHMTITHYALDFTVQGPQSPPPPDMGPHCTALPQSQPPPRPPHLQTQDLTLQVPAPLPTTHEASLCRPPAMDIWWPSLDIWCWHLVSIKARTVDTSGRYASLWNAFLFLPFYHFLKYYNVS